MPSRCYSRVTTTTETVANPRGHHYRLSIGADLDRDIRRGARDAGISLEEFYRRAILLLKHAVEADRVTLITYRADGPHEQNVIIR